MAKKTRRRRPRRRCPACDERRPQWLEDEKETGTIRCLSCGIVHHPKDLGMNWVRY
jgi:uncharacterized Zn finger protein